MMPFRATDEPVDMDISIEILPEMNPRLRVAEPDRVKPDRLPIKLNTGPDLSKNFKPKTIKRPRKKRSA